MSKFLRVDMANKTVNFEEVPEQYSERAGRWLTSTLVAAEVDPQCHPLGPNNKLVFAPGIVTGTPASTSARISVGGKSPLTGGIKESNAGSKFAAMQARLGIKAIVVEGLPADDRSYLLEIKRDGARLLPADDLAGKGAYETTETLIARYGKVGVCCIGPAGEFKLASAGISFNDQKDRASRYAGRGGMGAVMGSKGLKVIVLDDAGGPGVEIADKRLFDQGRILGNGAVFTGKAFGVTRVPAVKGQAMPANEPRAIKGIGITYATSTMGADHTAGYTIAPEILGVGGKRDPLDPDKADLSRAFQSTTAFIDTTGHCVFIAFAILDIPSGFDGMVEEAAAVVGANWTTEDVTRIGDEILRTERRFNEAAGLGKEADRMPEFMKLEPLPPHNEVWNVSDEELDSVYAELSEPLPMPRAA